MKNIFNILLNTLAISATPIITHNQTQSVSDTNDSNEVGDFSEYSDFKPPVASDFDTKEKLFSFYERESAKIGFLMQRDYAILQKLLKTDADINQLPFEEFTRELNLFSKQDFESYNYNFNDLQTYWTSIFDLIKEVNFNYEEFLNNYTKQHIKTDEDVQRELRRQQIFSIYQTKITDVVHIKVVAIEFEALTYLKDDPNNERLKELVFQLLRNNDGTNPSSPRFEDTLKQFIPVIQEIRKLTGRNLINELLKEEENNLAFEKAKTQTKQEIEKIYGSEDYEQIKKRFESIQRSKENIEILNEIKNEAIIFLQNLKQKTKELVLKLENQNNFITRLEEATNFLSINSIKQEVLVVKENEEIENEKNETKIAINKTKGSDNFEIFQQRFEAAQNNKQELINLRREAIDKFNNEKQTTLNLIEALKNKINLKQELESANNVSEIKIIFEKAKKIQLKEEIDNHINEANQLVLKTKGSAKFLEFKKELNNLINNPTVDLLEGLKQKLQNEFDLEFKKAIEQLNKIKNKSQYFELNNEIKSAKNIEDLIQITSKIQLLQQNENNSNQNDSNSNEQILNDDSKKQHNSSQDNKVNVAAVVTPIVLIIIFGIAGFLAYWFIKKTKAKKVN